jgi:ureidoglycolate amidohydrolase
MGNIFGIWQGSGSDLGMVLTGSHCDAIPLAGAYDGTLGVIGAIEALAALKRAVSLRQ